MKLYLLRTKFLVSLLILLFSKWGFAQLPDGSIAPDFTITDLNGDDHTLSSYLNDGISVLLVYNASFSQDAYDYSTNELQPLYDSYGPEIGDSTVMIFNLMADSAAIGDLTGTLPGSPGDWLSNTSFPIFTIISPGISSLFSDYGWLWSGYVYKICPTGILESVGTLPASDMILQIDTTCCIQNMTNDAALRFNSELVYCSYYNSQINIANKGTNTLTSATIEYSIDGVLSETVNWTGNLDICEAENIDLVLYSPVLDFELDINIVSVNGTTDDSPSDNQMFVDISHVPVLDYQYGYVEILTDNSPDDNNIYIIDAFGNEDYALDGSLLSPNTLYTDLVFLPDSGCYTFQVTNDFTNPGSYVRFVDPVTTNDIFLFAGAFGDVNEEFRANGSNYVIRPYAFLDADADGIYNDAVDYIMYNQTFSDSSGMTYLLGLDGLGVFIPPALETYKVVYESDGTWNAAPPYHYVEVDGSETVYEAYYELTPEEIHGDVLLDITSGIVRCDWSVPYWITAYNESTSFQTDVIEVVLPEDTIEFVSSIPPPDSIDNNILYYSYTNLAPTYTESFALELGMPGVSFIGQDMVVTVNGVADTTVLSEPLNCSYDPNDKLVDPAGIGQEGFTIIDQETFIYTIRFQNTGTDTAFNIVVLDSIEEDLDFSSFQFLSSSHPCITSVDPSQNLLSFNFENIMLPDSGVNQIGSNGYVKFQIRPNAGLLEFTEITNTAGIYFDLNPPIITNTTLNTLVKDNNLPSSVEEISDIEVQIFPNPAHDYIRIESSSEIESIEIYALTGELLIHESHQEQFDISGISPGTYLIKISDGDSYRIEKLVKL